MTDSQNSRGSTMSETTEQELMRAAAERLRTYEIAATASDAALRVVVEVGEEQAACTLSLGEGGVWMRTMADHTGQPDTDELIGGFPPPPDSVAPPPWGQVRPLTTHDSVEAVVSAVREWVVETTEKLHAGQVADSIRTLWGYDATVENDGGGPYVHVARGDTSYSLAALTPEGRHVLRHPADGPSFMWYEPPDGRPGGWSVSRLDADGHQSVERPLLSDYGYLLPADADPREVAEAVGHAMVGALEPRPPEHRDQLETLAARLHADGLTVAFGGQDILVAAATPTGIMLRIGVDAQGYYAQTAYHTDPPGTWLDDEDLSVPGADLDTLARDARLSVLGLRLARSRELAVCPDAITAVHAIIKRRLPAATLGYVGPLEEAGNPDGWSIVIPVNQAPVDSLEAASLRVLYNANEQHWNWQVTAPANVDARTHDFAPLAAQDGTPVPLTASSSTQVAPAVVALHTQQAERVAAIEHAPPPPPPAERAATADHSTPGRPRRRPAAPDQPGSSPTPSSQAARTHPPAARRPQPPPAGRSR